jgi:hypothetical protein
MLSISLAALLVAGEFRNAPADEIRRAVASHTARADGACGSSGGRYDIGWPHPDSSDTDGHCDGDVNNYQGAISWSITQINAGIRECEEVRMFLLYDSTPFEWTGWVEDEYWQDGGTWGTEIGVHWDWMDSTWLWVHQGSIGLYNPGVVEANLLAEMCASQ